MRAQLAVLVSGRGSNLEAILEAIDSGNLAAVVTVVISNKANVGALDIAARHKVEALTVESRGLCREEHEEQMLAALSKYRFDYIVLAGYMRILSPQFLKQFFDVSSGLYRVVNIHPSLLPAFPGANAYEEAFNAGVTESGITVHLVDEKVDHGPILSQMRFARLAGDSLDSFKERGLAVEHRIYPQVLQRLAQDGLQSLAQEFVKK